MDLGAKYNPFKPMVKQVQHVNNLQVNFQNKADKSEEDESIQIESIGDFNAENQSLKNNHSDSEMQI